MSNKKGFVVSFRKVGDLIAFDLKIRTNQKKLILFILFLIFLIICLNYLPNYNIGNSPIKESLGFLTDFLGLATFFLSD